VSEDCLKVTVYFGERARVGDAFLADVLSEIYARHELRASIVMRAVEGFGAKHGLRTDRLLSLSDDLPLASVAVDTRARIEAALADIDGLRFSGLVTLERARMITRTDEAVRMPPEAVKLTVYVGRQERVGSRPAHEAIVDELHAHRVAGATVLLGIDGTVHGVRRRARFFARNAEVPLMVIAVGDAERIATALGPVTAMQGRPLATLERVRVCKRDGLKLAEPRLLPESDGDGRPVWAKLMVYAGEQSRVSHELVRELRAAGAAGATSLRGIWGYHGDHRPHGDRFWALERHVPVVTVIVDTPERSRAWFEIVDRLTDATGLVTSELVPAYRPRE
jgi:PII-like signaling protein